ncbi:unnamed protein product, partial [Symbiodinium necroappetens]
ACGWPAPGGCQRQIGSLLQRAAGGEALFQVFDHHQSPDAGSCLERDADRQAPL